MRKRIKRIKGANKKIQKMAFSIQERQNTHTARIYGMQKIGNEFKEVTFGSNTVLIGGLRELMLLLYNKRPAFTKPTFEDTIYTTAEEDLRPHITKVTTNRDLPYIQGFNISHGGAQGDGVIKYPRHGDGYDLDTLIPFRVIPKDTNDFTAMKQLYLHHREVTIDGKPYIEYYTKKLVISVNAVFKNGQPVANDPAVSTNTDLDSRVIAEFPVELNSFELVEHFRLREEEGSADAHFNSTMMMIGCEGAINIDGTSYPTMYDSHAYTRSNHVSIPHGTDSFLSVKYQLMHI